LFIPRKAVGELKSPNAVRARARLLGAAVEQAVQSTGAVGAGLELEAVVLRNTASGERTTLVAQGQGRDDPGKLAAMAEVADGGGIARAALRKLAKLDAAFPRSRRVGAQLVRAPVAARRFRARAGLLTLALAVARGWPRTRCG